MGSKRKGQLKWVKLCFFLKIVILCIWYNRICWHALIFKKHIIFQILYIIVGPLCLASLKRFVFYKVPPSDKHSLLWLANWHSALWLAEHHKPRRKCNAPLHNLRALAFKIKVKTVNNVLSFTISSSPIGEQSHVTDTVMKLRLWCDRVSLLSHTRTHTHTLTRCAALWPHLSLSHTHDTQNSAFEQSIANTYVGACLNEPF